MTSHSGLPFARLAAEFGVIVVGVLVALIAESAWEERGERAEEREALLRIREEIAVDSTDIQNDAAWFELARPAAEEAVAVLAGTDTLSDDAALAVVYGAVLVNTTVRPQGTWHDLTSAGRSDLISDPDLRRRLVNYYNQRERREETRTLRTPTGLRTRVVSTLPVEYMDAVLMRCIRRERRPGDLVDGARADAFESLLACDAAPEGGAGALLERIRAAPDVDLELGALRYGLRTVAEELRRTEEMFDSLTFALDRAIAASR